MFIIQEIRIGREATAPLRGRVFKISKKSAFLLNNKVRRSPGTKHCSSLCSQSEGANIVAAKHELKIQQSHAPERWSCSLCVRGPHFANKVSYNAGAATDDCAGAAQISAARALPLSLIFSGFLTPYFRGPRSFFPRCSPLPALSSLFSDSLCPSANLGADADASAPRHVRLCSQIRLHQPPDSLASAPAFAGRHRASFWKKTWRCVPMRPWRFKIRLSPSVSGHSAVCLLSCATKICRAETNIKKSRDIPPNSQKLLLLLPVSIYLRKKT